MCGVASQASECTITKKQVTVKKQKNSRLAISLSQTVLVWPLDRRCHSMWGLYLAQGVFFYSALATSSRQQHTWWVPPRCCRLVQGEQRRYSMGFQNQW